MDGGLRALLIALMAGLPALGVAIVLWGAWQLSRFLGDVREIATEAHLEEFRRVAARQMYAALVQIGVLVPPLVLLYPIGVLTRVLAPGDILYALVPAAGVLVAGILMKRLERRVQTIPASAALQAQRDAVTHAWLHKALPDW